VILPDANVLVGAYRADSPHHNLCRPWLEDLLQSGTPFGICGMTLAAVMRLTIDPRIFASPSKVPDVFLYCKRLLSHPWCQSLDAGERHWPIFENLCGSITLTARLVTDAWLAAIAIEHGCIFVTLDRDFTKFPGLRWSFPV